MAKDLLLALAIVVICILVYLSIVDCQAKGGHIEHFGKVMVCK